MMVMMYSEQTEGLNHTDSEHQNTKYSRNLAEMCIHRKIHM